MFVAPYLNPRTPVTVDFSANLVAAFVAFVLAAAAMLHYGAGNAEFHTVLDTSVAVSGALIALLLWDVGRRTEQSWPLFLAICFAMTAISEFLHVVAALGWFGEGPGGKVTSRAGSWGPRAYLLPISVWAALLLRDRPRWYAWPLAAGLVLLGAALIAIFQLIPRYAAPGLLWITRPSLILVPLLWALVGLAYWKRRAESDIASAIAPIAVILAAAHGVMLYARAPADTLAMVAHFGKFVGDVLLLFNLTQIGAADTARRRQVEQQLIELSRDLDARVAERTTAQRRSQDMIEAIITNSPAMIYVKDLAGHYLMINQRFAEVFQVDREAVIGKTDHDLFDQASADAYRAMDQRVAAADQPLTEEETAPLDDGLHTYLSVKSPLRDESGQAYALFGISTDITDQRRAQVALLASEHRNRQIVESALDAVVTIDSEGVIAGWSAQAETTFGWTHDEALGRSVDQLILPERYRAAHREGLARYLATGEARVLNKRIEIDALHRDGREFPVELSITPVRAGEAICFTAFVRDITDRKLAETRLQTQRDRLHLLEQVTRAISQRQDEQSIFQVVVRTLEDRLPADFVCICRYDSVAQRLVVAHVGTGSAALGRELGITEQAEIPIDGNGLSRCVGGELVYEPDIAAVDFPFPHRLAAHGLRSLVVAPLGAGADVFGVLVVARLAAQAFVSADCEFLKQVSDHVALAANQTQLRDRLQQAYDDLKHTQQAILEQERLRAIGQMASGIAHDINNAISPVAVYTQSLRERQAELGLLPEVRDYLETVGRVVKDISATAARMRDFYRPGDAGAEFEPVDLNTLILQVVGLTRARWNDMPQQRGIVITVSTALEAALPRIMGDAAQLREALTNLVFNAVDAMPDGGTITIRTLTFAGAGGKRRVQFEVGDTGPGMDEETRRRCLEPFFTTKGERGTGLGLAMVQGAAQHHKAELVIDTAPGDGTRIRLDFAATAKAKADPRRAAASRKQRPLRLLLVDDDPAVLSSTLFVLELNGHAITAADGGKAGIDALHAAHQAGDPFDVVITDLGMPFVDGNQVALTAKELFPETPVILLTGWGRRMATGDKAPAHVDFVLPKPLELDALRDIFAGLG
ncbi:MAG: hybrid sensor histidine kinase/response regulator [Sphingomonas bacterium]|uniref:PAS domain S-box protein n=1 Tax=Sphingomonas bacterium TaxID=1895847 RepID=UPI00261D8745|nr:PAS domain S-box protein [Sphingomonas bacterium]MDB5709768.1 hybrid sensor histidine kinase/response regulator [Sphingomonas bacterium]